MESSYNRSFIVRTLGCKANAYDAEAIERELIGRGWQRAAREEHASLCIVNSCSVTDEADRQSRKLASRLSRENPHAAVVMTGCSAEIDPERIASRTPGIHYVVGNQDKPRLVQLILERLEERLPSDPEILGGVQGYAEMLSRHPTDRDWPLPEDSFATPRSDAGRTQTRVFLKIQEGCNSFCTYCVIPYGRGPSRSLRPDVVVAQVCELVSKGVREIVITGTNIGDYGADWLGAHEPASLSYERALPELLERILNETSLERLRVSSLDPVEISPRLLGLMESEPRFCPHFHVSLQSASSKVLRLMKRKYDADRVAQTLNRISKLRTFVRPFVGMDVIVGFPGETDEEFDSTYRLLEQLPWDRLHVFPYSERAGTPATRLPLSVPQEQRRWRAERLKELSLKRLEKTSRERIENRKLLADVLIEGPRQLPDGRWLIQGHTPDYLHVEWTACETQMLQGRWVRNELASAQIVGLRSVTASGEVILEAQNGTGLFA